MLNEYELASAKLLLGLLERGVDQSQSASELRRYLPEHVIVKINEREDEYKRFNRDMTGTVYLSPDAAGYWSDFQKMLRFGRLHHSLPVDRSREKKLSRLCERLEESFDARVSDQEKGMFLVFDPQRLDGGNWDDRWHACVDWFPPILREEYLGGVSIENPKKRAQIEVITDLLTPAQPSGPPTGLGQRLRKYAQRE